jgi:hypothetical protein
MEKYINNLLFLIDWLKNKIERNYNRIFKHNNKPQLLIIILRYIEMIFNNTLSKEKQINTIYSKNYNYAKNCSKMLTY